MIDRSASPRVPITRAARRPMPNVLRTGTPSNHAFKKPTSWPSSGGFLRWWRHPQVLILGFNPLEERTGIGVPWRNRSGNGVLSVIKAKIVVLPIAIRTMAGVAMPGQERFDLPLIIDCRH